MREHLLVNIAAVIGGAIAMQIVISLVRALLPKNNTPAATAEQGQAAAFLDPMTAQGADLALLFFAMLGPLAIVIVEEAVYRHTLLVKLPLWGSRTGAVKRVA